MSDLKNNVLGRSNPTGPAKPKGDPKKFAERFGILPQASASPKEDELYSGLYSQANKWKDPKSLGDAFENISKLPEDIPKSRQRYYKEAQEQFSQLSKQIGQEYQKNKNANNWAQIGELIGQAVTRFAAAKEGMRTGVDLSTGLKFKPTDWVARQSQLFKEVQAELDSVKDQAAGKAKEQDDEQRRFDREGNRLKDAQIRKVFEEIAAGRKKESESRKNANKNKDKANKEAERKEKEAEKFFNSAAKQLAEAREAQAQSVANLKALDEDSLQEGGIKEIGKLMGKGVITESEGNRLVDLLNEDSEDFREDVIGYLENKKSSIAKEIDPKDREAMKANYMGQWPAEEIPEEIKNIWKFKYNYEAR